MDMDNISETQNQDSHTIFATSLKSLQASQNFNCVSLRFVEVAIVVIVCGKICGKMCGR